MSHTILKNHRYEKRLFNWRLSLIVIFCLILFTILITRLAYLQIIDHARYKTLSKNNQLALVPLPPTRGLIYDRHGILLAENKPTFSLEIIPERIKNIKTTLAELRKIISISDDDEINFTKQFKQVRRFESIPLRLHLTEKEVARFAVNQHRFPGVAVKARLLRHYPLGDTFAHVVGYVGRIDSNELQTVDPTNYSATQFMGKVGLEKSLESHLHGHVGYQQIETDATGQTVRVMDRTPAQTGHTLYLTLDSHLQAYANKLLNGYRGALVAVNPNNGEVLTLASSPTYDPNAFVQGISAKLFTQLQMARDKPLYNRAIHGLYPPGSTIKPFVSIMSLATDIVTPRQRIFDYGWFKLPNARRIYHDMVRSGHGWINLRRALIVSCDVFFYRLAEKLGIQRLDWILTQFGFGQKTGIELTEENAGILPSPAWKKVYKYRPWYTGDTIITGIGQGFTLATPLQLAVAMGILANNGKHMQPHLIQAESILPKQRRITAPVTLGRIKLPDEDQQIWSFVQNALAQVVVRGTGQRRFGDAPYRVAAKTGTAQVISIDNKRYAKEDLPERLRDHSWFIAYAPTNKPQIAIATIVENNMDAQAVTITREFLDYYFKHTQTQRGKNKNA